MSSLLFSARVSWLPAQLFMKTPARLKFEYVLSDDSLSPEWEILPVNGSWFPHMFIGSMAEIMKAKADHSYTPDNSVEDCIYTMRCVEAAYTSGKITRYNNYIPGKTFNCSKIC